MKKPAERGLLTHSAGFAIRSPRGIGEPHDIAPRGSQHLSTFQYAPRQAARKAMFAGPPSATRRWMHLSANQSLATGTSYRQRKICSATTKLTTPHAVTMPNGAPRSLSRLPSIMTARRASFSAVSGSAFTNGCIASGKRAYEKKVPDRIHIEIGRAHV